MISDLASVSTWDGVGVGVRVALGRVGLGLVPGMDGRKQHFKQISTGNKCCCIPIQSIHATTHLHVLDLVLRVIQDIQQ